MVIASQPGSAAPQMKSFSGSSNWKGQGSQVQMMQKSVKPSSSSEDVIQPLHAGKPQQQTTEVAEISMVDQSEHTLKSGAPTSEQVSPEIGSARKKGQSIKGQSDWLQVAQTGGKSGVMGR